MFSELESDNLGDILASHEKVFVMYGAGWCGNCRMIKPKLKRKSGDYTDINFVYANAEDYPGSRAFAEVSNLPTYAIFKSGEKIEQKMGNKWDNIEALINTLVDA